MKSLQEQLDSLNSKMYKYREEKPKLLRKANEPKKEMESLKKELEETKKAKEKTEQDGRQKRSV